MTDPQQAPAPSGTPGHRIDPLYPPAARGGDAEKHPGGQQWGDPSEAAPDHRDSHPHAVDVTSIATLPPLVEPTPDLAVDPRTGVPLRPRAAVVATCCFAAAALAWALALVFAWWGSIHMQTFATATRLIAWTSPRPGSLASVLLVTALALVGMVMVGTAGVLAVNTWLGRRWVRWGGIAGIVVAGAAALFNWQMWLGAPFALAGLVLVWTPGVRRWFELWHRIRHRPSPRHRPTGPVRYGPVPQHM